MEGKQNHEHGCCSHDHNETKCCCYNSGRIRLLIKVVVVIFIFFMGVCVGSIANRHENERNFGKDFRGCPMLRNNTDGSYEKGAGQVPSTTTSTTTTK